MKTHISTVLFLALGGQLLAGSAQFTEEAAAFVFGNSHLQLRFDRQTGVWMELRSSHGGLFTHPAARPALDMSVGGKMLSGIIPGPSVFQKHEFLPGEGMDVLKVTLRWGEWDICSSFSLYEDGTLVRAAEFAYLGEITDLQTEVRNANFLLPDLQPPGDPADAHWFALAEYPPFNHEFRYCEAGKMTRPSFSDSTFHALVLRSPQDSANLVAAYYTEDERAALVVQETESGVDVIHQNRFADSLRPGLRFQLGSQLIRFVRGDRRAALEAVRSFYRIPGLRTDIGIPADIAKNVFYSAHPRGTMDSGVRDVGGFANFAELLPEIRNLGVNVLWLMPFWYGPVYAPYDYYQLDPKCGTPEDLRALTDRAHSLGMRVLGDLIPHGPRENPPEFEFSREHPELVCRDKDGSMVHWWGCLYCDYANPGWQDYMADHASYWVRECGLDGYRVDVAAGGAPNWRPFGTNRPSFSGLKGGLELMRKARAACMRENPKTVFLAESQGPTMYSAAEHGYNWAFSGLLEDHIVADAPDKFVPEMLGYLELQKYAFPPDAYPIRFLENHDKLRARMQYGPGLHRALLAFCAFIKGVPLIYHEEEVGDEDFLAQLYGIRDTYDELALGEPDYLAVKARPGHVAAILRSYQGRHSVVLVNLANEIAEAEVSIPAEGFSKPGIFEAVGGKRLNWDPVVKHTLEPYGYAVLVVREDGDLPGASKKTTVRQESPAPVSGPEPEGLPVLRDGTYTAWIDPAKGGLIHQLRSADGTVFVRGMELREGERKLFPGCAPMDLGQTAAELSTGDDGSCTATSVLCDSAGVPRLRCVLTYTPGNRLKVSVALTSLADIPLTKSTLMLRLRFAPSTRWFARTTEGDLQGRAILRHPKSTQYDGRYWHGAGRAVFDSSLYPLRPDGGALGVENDGTADSRVLSVNAFRAEGLETRCMIVEDPWDETERQLGKTVGLAAEMYLLGGNRGTVWKAGEVRALSFELGFGKPETAAVSSGSVYWHTQGATYILGNDRMQARVIRSKGGELLSLTDANGQGPRITDVRFYTDKGLYGTWTDPRGKVNHMNASNGEDPEPETTLTQTEEGVRLGFRSFFRHPYAHGRSLLKPLLEYEILYDVEPEKPLRIFCGVRPHIVRYNTGAFLAYRLSLRGVDQWRVDGGEWHTAPETGDRVWQSREAGAMPRSLSVRSSQTGQWIRFSDVAGDPENLVNFFLVARGDQAHVFFAFYDVDPVDVRAAWRRTSFSVEAGDGQ